MKIVLPILLFILYKCSTFSGIGGDGKKSTLYLTQENGKIYRTERFPKNYLMKAKGPVEFSCSTPVCTKEELELPEKDLKSLSKEGIWEEYKLKEKDGQGDKNDDEKEYISEKNLVGEYRKNLREGKWKTLREDGRILMESEYVANNKNGIENKFGTKGQIIETSLYKNGLREGEYTEFTEKGLNKEKGFFKDNKRVGEWTVYYLLDEKGKEYTGSNPAKEVLECNNNLRNGKYKKFNHNGSLAEEAVFLDGRRNGMVVFYFPDGQKRSEGRYEPLPPNPPPKKEDEAKYLENYNKSLMQCAEMEDGSGGVKVHQKVGEWKEYYPSGKIFSIGRNDGGLKVGEWKYYSTNGTLRASGKMKNEIFMEEGKVFGEDGKIEGEGKFMFSILTLDDKIFEYKHNYKAGVPFKFYKNGVLTLELDNDPGGGTIAKKYDSNGNLLGSGPAMNGIENGCWTMKGGGKKYFIMGKENSKMGSMQNCN